MRGLVDFALVAVLLLDFALAASGRLAVLVRAFAIQAALLGALALLLEGFSNPHAWAVALGALLLKALAIPYLLLRAAERTGSSREHRPLIPYSLSVFVTAAGTGLAFALALRLPAHSLQGGVLLGAAAFATMFAGLLLLVSRGTALAQVVGYLVLENGIFLFGLSLLSHMPLIVEMGILLDVFVGAFVMGIVVYNIHRTFDHIDVASLTALRDEDPARYDEDEEEAP